MFDFEEILKRLYSAMISAKINFNFFRRTDFKDLLDLLT